MGCQDHILRPDGNHASLRHRLPRIQDHVPDDLSDLPRVHLGQPEIVRQGEFTPHPGAAQGRPDEFLDQAGQGGWLPNRRTSLALRWMIGYAKARPEKRMEDKIAGEILDASNLKGGAVKKREDVHKMAEANKAFAHYRW